MKILVVDDEHLVRWFMERALRKKGHEVVCASGVADAAEKINAYVFDMLFVDLRMAGGSGMELLEKALQSGKRPRVVVCSAFVAKDMEEDLRKKGIGVLIKPFDISELYNVVELDGR